MLRFVRPLTRSTSRNGTTQNDTFGYNPRSELVSATLGDANYTYAFDNIGNRETASEAGTALNYATNNLNQYTEIIPSESSAFNPVYDADGNATLIQTSTGTWQITYNGANRPIRFENAGTQTVVECGYDSQGRRYFKKVTVAGTVTLHHRYIYRGYLQIACVDCTRSGHPALWLTTWDPTQPTATRPLAIQKDGNWLTYGYDITKNICKVFGPAGYIRTTYSYAPFGFVTDSGDVSQPFQWSSEHYDSELDLVYYNYRHYSPTLGRFLSRDPIEEQGGRNLYAFVKNSPMETFDAKGEECIQMSDIVELDASWKLDRIEPEIDTTRTALGVFAVKAIVGHYSKAGQVNCCCPFLWIFKRVKVKNIVSKKRIRRSFNNDPITLQNPFSTIFPIPPNPVTLAGLLGVTLAEGVSQNFGFYIIPSRADKKRMEKMIKKFERGDFVNGEEAV